ncbi:hypothetical protein BDA99DRAFT_511884 [Phascolomyces articulosus]|uniref:Zn(2)-C6 fungal-type domain-containing protein n=1 Tax=Phascolomyces articulosus TaxID=60185 RepID=A0AAD5JZB5_9FUNG|nr:hypothetical protein BDA99DRAFT_511884 [Phascolomyces articulosus]
MLNILELVKQIQSLAFPYYKTFTMRNERPCSACRILRKKCVWLRNSDLCDRCLKHGTECIPIDVYDGTSSGEPVAQDGEPDLQDWWVDVIKVQNELQQMESEIQTSLRPTRMQDFESTPEADYSDVSQITSVLITSTSNSSSSSSSTVGTPKNIIISTPTSVSNIEYEVQVNKNYEDSDFKEPEWQLSIINGQIRLISSIQTIDELEMYTRASLRYLSPFAAIFETEQIHFDSSSISIALGSKRFIQRNNVKKPRKTFKAIGFDDTIYDYKAIADKLIRRYIETYNEMVGLLHVPTFMKYYNKLEDPLTDALTLAICVDAIVTVRRHFDYTPTEKRYLADYFYTKCKYLLLDMFEDPTRKFETVMATTLVQRYLIEMVMDCSEARRLTTVALLICADLDVLYITNKMGPVERVIYQRHRLYLEIYNQTFDMLLEDRLDFTAAANIQLETLEDEPEKTREYATMCNHIFRFAGSTYNMNLMHRINNLIHGRSSSLRFDDILRFEPVAREWFASLPEEYRICDDPFAPDAYEFVDKCESTSNILPFATLHMNAAVVTSSILQPRLSENSPAFDILRLVRDRAASLAVTSCKVLISVMKANLKEDSDLPSLSFEALFQVLYALDKLAACPHIEFPLEVRGLLRDCFKIVRKFLPADHQISVPSTHLESYLKNPKKYPLDFYEQYPLPGCALIYAIFMTSLEQLDRHLEECNKLCSI